MIEITPPDRANTILPTVAYSYDFISAVSDANLCLVGARTISVYPHPDHNSVDPEMISPAIVQEISNSCNIIIASSATHAEEVQHRMGELLEQTNTDFPVFIGNSENIRHKIMIARHERMAIIMNKRSLIRGLDLPMASKALFFTKPTAASTLYCKSILARISPNKPQPIVLIPEVWINLKCVRECF